MYHPAKKINKKIDKKTNFEILIEPPDKPERESTMS